MENRVKTINTFLETARRPCCLTTSISQPTFLDTLPGITTIPTSGRRSRRSAERVDYLSLMVYPSGYHLGIPGYLKPVAHPREVVLLHVGESQKAFRRTGKETAALASELPGLCLRPQGVYGKRDKSADSGLPRSRNQWFFIVGPCQ